MRNAKAWLHLAQRKNFSLSHADKLMTLVLLVIPQRPSQPVCRERRSVAIGKTLRVGEKGQVQDHGCLLGKLFSGIKP